jgi:hypothetical protein
MILRMRAYSATSTARTFRRTKREQNAHGVRRGMGENVTEIVIKTREMQYDEHKDVPIGFEWKLLGRNRGMDKTERKESAE